MEQANTAIAALVYSEVCDDATTLAAALKDVFSALKDRETLLEDAIENLQNLMGNDLDSTTRKVLDFSINSLKTELAHLQSDEDSE
jgi:hypothetical protein